MLAAALERIATDVDAMFDALLPPPGDARARLNDAMRYATIGGGKRLRPLLLAATAELYGVDRGVALRAACAVEAVHCYSLIHDDLPCMDDDALRHGKPTLHLAFDEATAVLAGDALQAMAFELLADPATTGDPFTRAEMVLVLARAAGAGGMVGGQALDIAAETQNFDLAQVTRLQQLKTGALLAASVELGAILGHVAPEGRRHLRAYAHDIGLAFQIADDVLDVTATSAQLGKTAGRDVALAKSTYVSLMGVDQARAEAEALSQRAIGHLEQAGLDAGALGALAEYIVRRES